MTPKAIRIIIDQVLIRIDAGSPLIKDKFSVINSITISIEQQRPIILGLREIECLQFPLEP